MANSTVCQSKWKPIFEPRRAKPKTYRQAPTHWLKFYEEAVIESESKKGKRKVQGAPQSQTAAHPRPQEEEETDKSKQAQTEQTYEKP